MSRSYAFPWAIPALIFVGLAIGNVLYKLLKPEPQKAELIPPNFFATLPWYVWIALFLSSLVVIKMLFGRTQTVYVRGGY